MRRIRLALAALCLIVGLWLTFAQPWIDAVTVSGQPRALWNASLPGLDLGLDTYPARPGQYGYVELWAYLHDADDIRPLIHLFGAPALPAAPPPTPVAPPKIPGPQSVPKIFV